MQFAFDGIHFIFWGQPFVLYYYGIILMSGTVAGGLLAYNETSRRGYDPDIVWDLLIWLIIGGIIGARLWHVFTPSPSLIAQGIDTKFYLTHPLDLINVRRGGLGIPGAVIGGALALLLFTRKLKLNFIEWADIVAPSIALGQAVGRWGNYFNQELYGAPTSVPWKIFIDPAHRLTEFINQEYYHPLFLYESLWNLGNMAILLLLSRKYNRKLMPGDLFLTYLLIYPVGRFFLDFLRLDASQLGGVNANQTFMAFIAVFAVISLLWKHRFSILPPRT
ncbi:MAG: prolipoprotein diacylglyceryl transferase [Chloroflexota bacterium]